MVCAVMPLGPGSGVAQAPDPSCTSEAEPNDAPDGLVAIAGPLCMTGELPASDQDLVLWENPAGSASTPWQITLEGVPGTLTAFRLFTIASEPGVTPIIAGPQVLEVAAQPDETGSVRGGPFLLPSGTLILGISRSAQPDGTEPSLVGYSFRLEPAPTPVAPPETEPNDDSTTAMPVAGATAVAGDAAGSWDAFAWTVDGTPDGQSWTVSLQATVGSSLGLTLRSPDGVDLATTYLDRSGRATLPDLQLLPGTWQLTLSGGADAPVPYVLTTELGTADGDPEPNDTVAAAIPIDAAEPRVRGRLYPEGDRDRYLLTIPADATRVMHDLKLLGGEDGQRSLCLSVPDGGDLQCRNGSGGLALRSLVLAPGSYLVTISGDADADQPYLLRLDATADPVSDYEQEPNDDPGLATVFEPATVMRGLGGTGDTDLYALDVAGDAQLWEVQLAGVDIGRLAWVRPDWALYAEGAVASDRTAATLTDLYLVPGRHWFRVEAGGDYTVSATPLGPPDPDAEREPNNTSSYAQPYRLGRSDLLGRLPSLYDTDVFRFTLAGTERVTLIAEPPADGSVGLELAPSGGLTLAESHPATPGVPSRVEAVLEAGDYEIWLQPDVPSLDRYRFRLERGDPFPVRADEEPNNVPQAGRPLPPSLALEGTMEQGDAIDWYRLPPIDPAAPLTIRLSGTIWGVSVTDGRTELPVTFDSTTLIATTDGLSGLIPSHLGVRATGPYSLHVEAPGLVATPDPGPPPVRANLVPETDTVGGYWNAGQRLEATLDLVNDGPETVELAVEAVTSHFGWHALPSQPAVTLEPGGNVKVPVAIVIDPDAWAGEPVRITARVRTAAGGSVTAATQITPDGSTDPVNPEAGWAMPPALLGGLDVASLALGATTIPFYDQVAEDQLHDGSAHTGMGFSTTIDQLPVTLTVDLAGDAAIPVAGFVLNPQGRDSLPGDVPLDVELLLSTDGATWTSAWVGRLTTLMADQAFVLPVPMPATQAQLRITSTHGGGFDRVVLGEWKVIAEPGVSPETQIDLAAPAMGGHIAWMDPQAADEQVATAWLDAAPEATQLYLEAGSSVTWVVGFRGGRAAQLTSLGWSDPIPSTDGQRFSEVTLEGSLEGPGGPWTPIGTWTLERAADGSVAPFTFDEPTWVRYLRFTGSGPRKEAAYWDPPGSIQAIERATDAEYRSAAGEWGMDASSGPLEWLMPPDVSVPPIMVDADDTPASATPLLPGATAEGRVDGRADVDWYTFTVPDGQNAMEVTVTGRPIVAVALTLTDAQGLEQPMLFTPGDQPGTVRYQAEVDAGATYRLMVEQPPASIVFTFDTSGSMGPYLDYVYQAMRAFTADVTPGEEFVQVIPFEEDPLLPDWSDDPWALQDAVGRYVNGGGSSSAEAALINATTALSAREGAKAVLMVTDAETSSFPRQAELWRILSAVRPMVAAVHVGATAAPEISTNYMIDWARVADGFYQYTRSHGEMDRAFDRLATWLRRPAGYRLDLATAFKEEPPASREPGAITVRSPQDGAVTLSPDVGVEIILDTSGSMLKEIKGRPRIELAKAVLRDLVTERLPAGAPVAVRVLGDRQDVCGTDLVVPLAPLDPASVVTRVDGIEVVQEADTPLGQALRSVPGDLEGSEGTKIVLLITDSEEVWPHPDLCGEDPAAAIRELRGRGIDARLNIVGLQVDAKKATQQLRRWARLGNGSFFAAKDGEQLGKLIRTAVSAPFRILDPAGNEVASGTVDGSGVPVPPGTYSVVVLTDPVVRFDDVLIEPGAGQDLQIPEPTPPPSLEPVVAPDP
jgi:Mg-chelatase subunit ChlD